MKTKLQTYDTYKPSGVEWLGEIPEHWEVNRLSNIGRFSSSGIDKLIKKNESKVRIVNYTDVYRNLKHTIDSTFTFMEVTTPESNRLKNLVKRGDLIFLPSSETFEDLGLCALIDDNFDNLSFSYHVLRFEFKRQLEHGFKKYFTNNYSILKEFSKKGKGSIRKTLNRNDFRDTFVFLPPLQEQTAIANFLDDKTTKIDQAIAIKQKQIELLKERRQILIQELVTGKKVWNGTSWAEPTEVKDSGVEWIGEIPEHWEVKPLKYIGNSIIGLTYSPNDLCDHNEGILVFRSSNLYEGKIKYGEKENVYVKSKISHKLMVKENDILICSRNGSRDLIGKCAIISKNDIGNSFGAFTTVFRSEINPYIFCILNSSIFKALSGMFLTSTINQLTIGNLNSILVPIPPKNEMDNIRSFIENINIKIDTAISLKEQEIEKLKEYKMSLINDVVTGKLRVPQLER
jgi:type I restriction enzyme S subunit